MRVPCHVLSVVTVVKRRMDSVDEERDRLGRLPGEVKVMMAIDMTQAMVGVCAEGIRAEFPGISEREVLEKLRERLDWSKRWQKRGRRRL
jgi:hypothetical protein